MRSCDLSWCEISKMVSIPKILIFVFLFLITVAEGGKKKSTEKIVIHVPYKILKHHHTHTKYKVITIPEPKNENTIIYLKEEIQPTFKYIPQVQTHTEITETQQKTPQPFIPPHQESAPALLESLAKHKKESSVQTDQEQEYSTIKDDQKPLESQPDQTSGGFVPSFTYKPMLAPQENLIPNYSFSPVIPVMPKQHSFTPKLLINPVYHPSYEAYLPKFNYQPMLHLPQGHFGQNYMFKQKLPPPKVFHDNVAYASNEVYRTVMSPRMKPTSYKVREDTEEELNMQSVKHQQTLNTVPVPSMKSSRRAKSHHQPGQNYQLKNLIPSHPEYEYEHIGYLIIDGKSKKIVGKNFKDQIHLSR